MGAGASVEAVSRVEAVFKTIDANSNGVMDVKELKKLLTGHTTKAHEKAEQWFQTFDADHDGKVTCDEFKAFFDGNAKQFGEEATGELLAWFEDLAGKFAAANPNAAEDAAAADADDAMRAEIKAKRLAAKEEAAAQTAAAAEVSAEAVAALPRAALMGATPDQVKACLLALKAGVASGGDKSVGTWDEAKAVDEWEGVRLTEAGQVERVDVGSTAEGTVALEALADILTPSLKFLKLLNISLVGDLGALAGRCPELRELWATGKELTGNVVVFANCPSLVRLKLRSSGVSGDVGNFADHSRLSLLWLEDTACTGDIAGLKMVLPKCDIGFGMDE